MSKIELATKSLFRSVAGLLLHHRRDVVVKCSFDPRALKQVCSKDGSK